MIKRLTRVDPFQAGKVLAALYLGLSLIFVPFFLLMTLVGSSFSQQSLSHSPQPPWAGMGLVFCLAIPVFYTVIGFVGGALGALIYNLVAKLTGGLELTFVDVAPGLPASPAGSYLPR